MDHSSLPGTYWTETERYYERYGDVNTLDPDHILDSAPGISVLLFGSGEELTEFIRFIPAAPPWIGKYYRNTTYAYDPETKLFNSDLHALHTGASVVTAWTNDRLEIIGYDRQGAPCGRQVFRRF